MCNEVISYDEMCQREGKRRLQRSMNYQLTDTHSVILISANKGAPNNNRIEDNGKTLIYQGHDISRKYHDHPEHVDQPRQLPSKSLTENGKFYIAALEAKIKKRAPEQVRVYEKLSTGVWSYNGLFLLVDAWQEDDSSRKVYKFKLAAVSGDEDNESLDVTKLRLRQIIPTRVKLHVWKRDGGVCSKCGASEELYFDHAHSHKPAMSEKGKSVRVGNVHLMCAQHNR